MSFINFESAREKERARNDLKEAREQMLLKAKQDAEKRAEREMQKMLSGETNWMLPSVASKFEQSTKIKSTKKKEKKSKKSKKSKKLSKKQKRNSSSSSEDNDSDSGESSIIEERRKKAKELQKKKKKQKHKHSKTRSSCESSEDSNKKDNNETWIEKPPCTDQTFKRDDWMMDASSFSIKTFIRDRNDQKLNDSKPVEKYDPATSSRELNPHWKTTGTGLPAFQKPRKYSSDEEPQRKRPQISNSSAGGWRKKPEPQNSIRHKATKLQKTSSSGSESTSESEPESKHTETNIAKNTFSSTNFLTDQQMNELGAKILKAELLGNTEIVKELKSKLEKAREQRSAIKHRGTNALEKPNERSAKNKEEHVILTRTDHQGNVRPLKPSFDKTSFDPRDLYGGRGNRKKSGKRTDTHVDGERVRYFPDDDKYDIKQMFEREKYTTSAEANLEFANIASKNKNPNDDLEDIFVDKISRSTSERYAEKRDTDRAINAHEKFESQLDNCDKCIDSQKMNKSLIVCMGEKIYLMLPWHVGLQVGHCLIVPTQHVSCATQLDEDSWEEVENFRKALTQMFAAQKKEVIFFEIANKLNRHPHLTIHCVPIPMSQGESAPFYFKKAIEESEHEWSINKQLVRLGHKKSLRNCIPKGLEYFWVHFNIDSGFAHVIEDQDRFPTNFALEIIGGMLHLDESKWRRPQKEKNYIARAKTFADWWKKYDCTQ